MDFPFKRILSTENETKFVADFFSKTLGGCDTVLLTGDLGTGKTFFVRSVCSNWGIENVSSPSFAIVNEYHNGKKIFHFDFYRIKKVEELFDIGFEDYLSRAEAVTFIEWADLFEEVLPKNNFHVHFDFIDNFTREITITKNE